MKSPFTGKEMSIGKEMRSMTFRKETYEITFHYYRCEDTGEQFEDELFSQLNYNQLVNQYRERHSIPFPEQIVDIREKYGVSAARMSEILGLGTNGYRLYENGEVPNQSNARLIQIVEDPSEFAKLVKMCQEIDESSKQKLFKKIDQLIEAAKEEEVDRQFEKLILGESRPNIMTGYKKPDLKKATEMIVFFTEKLQPWKTKLNKLLFYADFLMFKKYAFSISGISYRAIDWGPVPKEYHSIFDYLDRNEHVIIDSFNINDGIAEKFKPKKDRSFDKARFTTEELMVMDTVAELFNETGTSNIVELSHQEKAWLDNKDKRTLIDYRLGFDLKIG